MVESKKLALIRIAQILHDYSDERHPLSQEEIVRLLERDYNLTVERKAVGRNLALLKEAEMDIISTPRGCYLERRQFEDSELKLLIDGVLCSKHITAAHSKQLIEKLAKQSNIYFKKHIKNVYSVNERNKTDNKELFLNIELADEAIERGRQITFTYNKYGADKKLHKSATHTASPYQMILHNQHYYLMALNEKWRNMGYYRMDKITGMAVTDTPLTPLKSVEVYEDGISYKDLSSAMPYMFTDKPEHIEMLIDGGILDQVIDWFGYDIAIEPCGERYKVTLKASPSAMEFWALQYVKYAEITFPSSLRERIAQTLEEGVQKYN